MALVILVVDVFGDPLLEPLEHLLEVRLLVAGRRLLFGNHPRGPRGLARAYPVTEVHEIAVGGAAIERRRLARLRRGCDSGCASRWRLVTDDVRMVGVVRRGVRSVGPVLRRRGWRW